MKNTFETAEYVRVMVPRYKHMWCKYMCKEVKTKAVSCKIASNIV